MNLNDSVPWDGKMAALLQPTVVVNLGGLLLLELRFHMEAGSKSGCGTKIELPGYSLVGSGVFWM